MATAPVKSQPLHNFSLSLLKWGSKNQTNSHHRCRRRDSSSPPAERLSLETESESEHPKAASGSRPAKGRGLAPCSAAGEEEREKVEVEEKPWNLRPRRGAAKSVVEIGGAGGSVTGGMKSGGELEGAVGAVHAVGTVQSENLPKSMRLRGFVEAQGSEKKEKKKFWISLSREEIEEDIFAFTGSKPARRPRKRPKNVQKNLDNIFPGLWLVGVTPDAYRLPDAPVKR